MAAFYIDYELFTRYLGVANWIKTFFSTLREQGRKRSSWMMLFYAGIRVFDPDGVVGSSGCARRPG
jgi:hypothetical protein